MANRPTQLSSFFIVLLVVLLGLSFVSGLGLWYIHELLESQPADLPAWRSLCRAVHGIVNPALCVMFGFLWFNHIRGGWKMRVNRKSGGTLTALLIILIATGPAFYYGNGGHFWFTVHLTAGVALAIVLPIHWWSARKWVRSIQETGATNSQDQCSNVETRS